MTTPKVYYTVAEAAERAGCTEQWLALRIREGHVPHYKFGKWHVLDTAGVRVAQRLVNRDRAEWPTPKHATPQPFEGYTVAEAAEATGKTPGQLRTLCLQRRIPCQQIGVQWAIFDLDKARTTRPLYRRKRDEEALPSYASRKQGIVIIPPLTEREKEVIQLREHGNNGKELSFEEVGAALGLTRQRANRIYLVATRKRALLKERNRDVDGNTIDSN